MPFISGSCNETYLHVPISIHTHCLRDAQAASTSTWKGSKPFHYTAIIESTACCCLRSVVQCMSRALSRRHHVSRQTAIHCRKSGRHHWPWVFCRSLVPPVDQDEECTDHHDGRQYKRILQVHAAVRICACDAQRCAESCLNLWPSIHHSGA